MNCSYFEFNYDILSRKHVIALFLMYLSREQFEVSRWKKKDCYIKRAFNERFCESVYKLARFNAEISISNKLFEIVSASIDKIDNKGIYCLQQRFCNPTCYVSHLKSKYGFKTDRTVYRCNERTLSQLGYHFARQGLTNEIMDYILKNDREYKPFFSVSDEAIIRTIRKEEANDLKKNN